MFLYWTTLAVVAAVVVVLAGYLIAIAVQLGRTRRNVALLADELEKVGERTGPLPDKIGEIHRALRRVEGGFEAVDGHLSGVAELLES